MVKKERRTSRKQEVESEKSRDRTNIGVSIDTMIWRRLRALAIREGKLTGDLLDAAIKGYLDKYEK